ncbi:hypothetical protein D0A34_18220 [Microcoleus vaginatus PCC 9802]|uniref:hypothetical protein n=1 Tax=Microcoleus vaginatus TaxID=119532 RepID=UPI00020D29AA|nr:hypothetical protein MicvaDRAFT_1121 [Microcoleus vaginatus FGP-2]UNU20560.1 hypothetical protein D0A34_18220 [Microcoleus vaginatus PCC 9802]
MPANLLEDRDYTIIIARSDASRNPQHPWYEEWVEAQASLIDLAKKCQEFDSDGITLYEASTPMWKYKNSTVGRLAEILQRQNTEPDSAKPTATNLEEALKASFSDYFANKTDGKGKKGAIIVAVLDEKPEQVAAVAEIIVSAANKIEKDEEIGVSFIQIGDDLETREFLTDLDTNLQGRGARFDIVDTKFWHEIKRSSVVQFLIGAIND